MSIYRNKTFLLGRPMLHETQIWSFKYFLVPTLLPFLLLEIYDCSAICNKHETVEVLKLTILIARSNMPA